MTNALTPSQTVGPFLHIGLEWPDGPFVVPEGTDGAMWIRGRITDGAGAPVTDALVETWQADPDGRFFHSDDPLGSASTIRGFGRCPTDGDGMFGILTMKPGAVPGPGTTVQAPHLDVAVYARGLLHQLLTRCYFADEAESNAVDPVLAHIDESGRSTLVAETSEDGYRFDIRLQGEYATVFFDA